MLYIIGALEGFIVVLNKLKLRFLDRFILNNETIWILESLFIVILNVKDWMSYFYILCTVK